MKKRPFLILILILGACETVESTDSSADVGPDQVEIDVETLDDIGTSDTFVPKDTSQDLSVDIADEVEPCSDLSWTTSDPGSFPPRDHHATFITTIGGPRLHVVGGTNYQTVFSDHWVADIGDDGALGAWRLGAPLPLPRSGQSVISDGNQVWLVGGRNLARFQTTTYRAEWKNEEIVGWIVDEPLPEARFHSTGVATNGKIWVTGGLGGTGEAEPTIYRGTLGDEGEVLSWETLTLPEPRSHHGTFTQGDDIYLAFGFFGSPVGNQTTSHLDIVKFPASTGPTIELENFFTGSNEYATMAATATDDCVRTFGGIVVKNNLPEYLTTVLRFDFSNAAAKLDTNFSLGRSHMHQAPYYGGAFYVVGGSIGPQDVTSDVEIGRVSP